MLFALSQKNKVQIPFSSIEEVKNAYHFHNLQSFLDIYYQGASVLIDEEDFYTLTYAYLSQIAKENVRHVEIFLIHKRIQIEGFLLKQSLKVYIRD